MTKRRRRLNDYEKVLEILNVIRDMNWTMKDFLFALQKYSDKHTIRKARSQFFDYAYCSIPNSTDFSKCLGPKRTDSLLNCWAWKTITEQLRCEIKALAEDELFGLFFTPTKTDRLGSLKGLQQVEIIIRKLAPRWLNIIYGACQEFSSCQTFETLQTSFFVKRCVIILAALAHYMRPNRSTNFQTVICLYLYQGGARRRVLDTLCRLGLTISYTSIQRRMADLTEEAQRAVQVAGRSANAIVTWDNFEFTEGRRGERIGDHREFRSITTALVFSGRGFEDGDLQQHMWRPYDILLSAENLVKKLQSTDIDIKGRIS